MAERAKRFDPANYFNRIRKEDVLAIAQAGWKYIEDHKPSFVTRAKERAQIRRRNHRLRKEVIPVMSQEIRQIAADMNLSLLHTELEEIRHDRHVEKIIHRVDETHESYLLAVLIFLVNPEKTSEEILDEDIVQLAAHFTAMIAVDGTYQVRFEGLK